MTNPRQNIRATILILVFHISTLHAAKSSARPVHEVFEVINEQARIDDKRIQTSPGLLPYGNPLAGNSQHNAQLHAQNQQAMFNAERVRQHRAQLQILNKGPTHADSYMRAYHESQENHHLALEKQQANMREKKPTVPVIRSSAPSSRPSASSIRSSSSTIRSSAPATRSSASVTRSPTRQRQTLKRIIGSNLAKIMQEEAESEEKNRNHRSYGSVEYRQYLQPQHYKTVYSAAGPTYDEGVTIKPNGYVGLTSSQSIEESSQILTQAIPSKTQYVYPKQYSQMQQYQSAQDIASLNSILEKKPEDQLTELNALIHSDNKNIKELETPVDFYYHLKDPSLAQHYAHSMHAQIPKNYASAYMQEVRDYTPITEEVDDVEDTNAISKRPFTPRPTHVAYTTPEDVTTNINYYSVESTVATNPEYHSKKEQNPSYEALRHERPLKFYDQNVQEEDSSERYLHHNSKHVGLQHLNEDGTVGVSAYGDDNLQYAANYEFGYHVRDHHSGNDFGHHEKQKNGNTAGHYHVLLPDGRMQNVNYRAGPDGFHADISYDLEK